MMILMINIKSLFMLAVVTIIAVSCARLFSKSNSKPLAIESWANMSVDEFQAFIADPAVQLLDVRTQEEFDEGHIAGATLVDVNDSTFVDKAMAVLDPQREVAPDVGDAEPTVAERAPHKVAVTLQQGSGR